YLILVCSGIHAQLWYEAGIRAGANVSTQFTSGADSNVETNWKPGVHIGIFGILFYTEKMAGQLEFLYSQKGSVWSDPDYSGDEGVSYIDLPLTARFQVLELLNLPIKLNIAFRYIEGLIVASDSRYYPDPWKNRVFQLSLSYAIWGE
ncbi:MAG: hypothetical protein U9R49_11895, partial [Bacteroidota bacterium]|nr:hypothetical protein [Bacteroidota bacterium]